MKPKGFKGRYFSLAAILAVSTAGTLHAQSTSYTSHDRTVTTQKEPLSEEETPQEEISSSESESGSAQFDPIVVTATKSPTPLSRLSASIQVITAQEIEERHYTSLSQALMLIPGISITSSGSFGSLSSLSLRGSTNKRTLILIDGVRYNDPANTSGAQIEHIDLADVERIEIIKGAQSGIWGAEASAGVINIITKSAAKGTHAGITLESGSYGTKKAAAFAAYNTGTADIRLDVSHHATESFSSLVSDTNDNPEAFESDPYTSTTYALKAGTEILGDDRLEISHRVTDTELEYDDFGYDAFWNSIPLPDEEKKSDFTATTSHAAYTLHASGHTAVLSMGSSKTERFEYGAASWSVEEFLGRTGSLELRDTVAYGSGSFTAGLNHTTLKADYTMGDGTSGSDEHQSDGIFLTNTNTLGNLILTESLRRDDYNTFDDKTTGKIGAKYTMHEAYLSANYGTAYTTPSIIEILNPWGTANPDLKPETFAGYDITLGYEGLSLTYYRNTVEDLITWDSGTSQNVNSSGKNTFKGYELLYKEHFTALNLALSLAYSQTSAKDDTGAYLNRLTRNQTDLALDWYPTDALHLGLYGNYVGKRLEETYSYGTQQTGRYGVVNMALNYTLNETFRIYAKGDNLTDKRYQSVYGYATAGRSAYAGIEARF